MKKILFILLSIFSFQAIAQDDPLIKETLLNYLDGGTDQDTARLNRAFHPACILRNLNKDNRIADMPYRDFISKAKPGQKLSRTTKIVSYNYVGGVGSAVVEAEYDSFKYVDILNLFKINGNWKIVSRLFTRAEKGIEVASFVGGSTSYSQNSSINNTGATTSGAKKAVPKPAATKPKTDDGW